MILSVCSELFLNSKILKKRWYNFENKWIIAKYRGYKTQNFNKKSRKNPTTKKLEKIKKKVRKNKIKKDKIVQKQSCKKKISNKKIQKRKFSKTKNFKKKVRKNQKKKKYLFFSETKLQISKKISKGFTHWFCFFRLKC